MEKTKTTTKGKKQLVSFTLPPDVYGEFRKYCDDNLISGAKLVGVLMQEFINNKKNNK